MTRLRDGRPHSITKLYIDLHLCQCIQAALGPNHPPRQTEQRDLYSRMMQLGREANHSPPARPKLRTRGAMFPLHNMFSRCGSYRGIETALLSIYKQSTRSKEIQIHIHEPKVMVYPTFWLNTEYAVLLCYNNVSSPYFWSLSSQTFNYV